MYTEIEDIDYQIFVNSSIYYRIEVEYVMVRVLNHI